MSASVVRSLTRHCPGLVMCGRPIGSSAAGSALDKPSLTPDLISNLSCSLAAADCSAAIAQGRLAKEKLVGLVFSGNGSARLIGSSAGRHVHS